MEGINESLNNDGKDEVGRHIDPENQMQGLFFDLLSCLGGGDHPKLPQGYKQKPMTGFLDIVEAFNDVSKLRNAGSGILYEVDSKEFDEKGNLKAGINKILELKTSNESSNANTDSQQSFLSELNAQRLTSASTNSDQSIVITKPVDNDTKEKLIGNSNTERQSYEKKPLHYRADDKPSTPEDDPTRLDENNNYILDKYDDASSNLGEELDDNANHLHNQDVVVNNVSTNNEDNSMNRGRIYGKSSHIYEVGPPLTYSDSSILNPMRRDINMLEKEMSKYSEELREIEQMLKEHIRGPVNSHQQHQPSEAASAENELHHHHQYLNYPSNMVQTLTDGMMSPSDALEMMYNMESSGSPYNPQSPRTSTYDSCTSFSSCQAQNQVPINCCFINPSPDSIKRSSSFYMDCLNLNDSGTSDFAAHVMTSLGSQYPSYIHTAEMIQIPHTIEQEHSVGEFTDCDDGDENLLQTGMVNEFTSETDIYGDNTGYYSVNEESDVQESTDAEDLLIENQRKKKIRFIDDKKGASSEDEHLWTSASGSEYGDVYNGSQENE